MKVCREVEVKVGRLKVGDRIYAPLAGEKHTATAIREEEGGMLFLLDEYLNDGYPMNMDGSTMGGYQESDLRARLREIADELPKDFWENLLPFENGDFLSILSLKEMLGASADWREIGGQIDCMTNEKNRTATRTGQLVSGWLRDAVSPTEFAVVNYHGSIDIRGASHKLGVRPAFKIAQPQESEQEPPKSRQEESAEILDKMDEMQGWPLTLHRGKAVDHILYPRIIPSNSYYGSFVASLRKAIWYLQEEIRIVTQLREGDEQ